MFPGLIIIGVISIVIAFIVFSYVADQKRMAAIEEVAKELGLGYEKDGNGTVVDGETSSFKLMNRGRSCKHRNVISAITDDLTIRLFDYRFTTGSGKNSKTHRQTVALIRSTLLRLPTFHARPEGMLDGIGSALGFQDIDFEEHKAFSDTFVLKSEMESETRAFFNQTLLDFFASRPKINFEASGNSFLFYQARHSVKPDDLKNLLAEAYQVFATLRERVG